MNRSLDGILKQAAEEPNPVSPDLLDRIAGSIEHSLRPVRPLPPAWLLASGLASTCIAISVSVAAGFGFAGVLRMNVSQRALIFPLLAALIVVSATSCVSEMVPGARRWVNPRSLLAAGTALLLALFLTLFQDYQTHQFLSCGLACFIAGLLPAIPTALISWLLLRRGFAVSPGAAGTVAGTLAGLAGVTMLELHCPNFEVFHVMLWHTAVIVFCGALGSWLGRYARS